MTHPRRRWLAAILGAAALGGVLVAYGYWPGILNEDSRQQYEQVVANVYRDWHPTIMAWLWRRLLVVAPGPGPLLVVQLTLFWAGLALAGSWAWRRGRPALGLAIVAVGWLPAVVAQMGTIMKDTLMVASLTAACGMLLWREDVHGARGTARWTLGILVALGFAAALRFNAFAACLPLLIAVLPHRVRATGMRLAITSVATTVALLAIVPVFNRVVRATPTQPFLSLVIFDLGGITEFSGVSQFPDMGLANPVATNHGCYDPRGFDSYADAAVALGFAECPFRFRRVQSALWARQQSALRLWLRAIVAHPVAYARHRMAHWNASTRFLVGTEPRPIDYYARSVPNAWGVAQRPNVVLDGAFGLAITLGGTPLAWPIAWAGLSLAVLILSLSGRSPLLTVALAASALLYTLGYLVFGVGMGLRYYLWTIVGGGVAAALLVDELVSRQVTPSRAAYGLATLACVLPILLGLAARQLLS